MTDFLANIPADQVGMIIGAIITALVGGGFLGQKITEKKMHLGSPVPEVPTRKITYPPSWDAHQALMHRVTHLEGDMLRMGDDIKAIRHEQAAQFKELMKEGSEREMRLGEKLEAIATDIHRRIDAKLK
ncbi:MAG: hypothetical protein ACNA8L_10350 [Luteolibacter sp.]